MSGEERRKEILKLIGASSTPVSGTVLAEEFHVSRQVIVQDIALLRASHEEIIATSRGYILKGTAKAVRIFPVCHTDEEILEELNIIVDNGGVVQDVFIRHQVYGEMRGELRISSRKKALNFVESIQSGQSSPLKNITSGYHYHTVQADSESTLDAIEEELRRRCFLQEEHA